jgi:quercetin dioxygenase-like cupin family protein
MTLNSKDPSAVDQPIPADDPNRTLTVSRPADPGFPHIGVVGDTYTILLTGKDTGGRYCLVDMHVPPGGGPPPHRHDFEESFTMLDGEIEVIFRGQKMVLRAGETANIPANAPHQFQNKSDRPVRMLCICSPAGQEEFFLEIGVPVAGRTTPPPKPDPAAAAALKAKSEALAGKYRTEFLKHA